jgi:hypothetical protein
VVDGKTSEKAGLWYIWLFSVKNAKIIGVCLSSRHSNLLIRISDHVAKMSMGILIARFWRHSDVKRELSKFSRNYVRSSIERQNQRSSQLARIREIPAPSPRQL